MRDLTQHLTTRADDSHAAPVSRFPKALPHLCRIPWMSRPGKVFRVVELNHILHRLCGPPSIPLSFNLAAVLPRRRTYRVSYDTDLLSKPTSSSHRLRRGLPGYLILFATHAFVPQCQNRPRRLPSPSVFFQISTHFTATPGVPPPSTVFESDSIDRNSQVKPGAFTIDLSNHLRTLYAQ